MQIKTNKTKQQKKTHSKYRCILFAGHHQVRQFEFRPILIKSLLGVVALMFVGIGVSTASMIYYKNAYQATEVIRVQNAKYDQERSALQAQVAKLEQIVERTDRLAVRLTDSVGSPSNEKLEKSIGPISDSLNLPTPSANLNLHAKHDNFGGMEQKMDQLRSRAIEVESKLSKVYDVQQEQNSFWAALPSNWPVKGYVTSAFGPRRANRVGGTRFHQGLDIAAPIGTTIHATGAGVVKYAGYKNGYGKTLIIDHGFGIVTLYGHSRELLVNEGDRVVRGKPIAYVGMTGRTTGAHVHYEVSVDGVPVDPMRYLARR